MMARIVMKFGGTSVADLDRIRTVAMRVRREVEAGHEIAVVVSAMAGTTNQLVGWCQSLSSLHDAREYDALAAALKADRCDIYTDVDGVYTTDPRIVARARKLERISYEEMLELASVGAKVLQTRSVELAMKEKVRVQVLSSFQDSPGTLVVDEDEIVEKELVSGIAYSRDEAKLTVRRVPDRPGVAATVFGALTAENVNVDMIVQNISEDGMTDMTFTVGRSDLPRAQQALASAKPQIGYADLLADTNVAKISVVGVGMRSHAGIASTMFRALADKGINIQVISTSEIKVSILIAADYTELAVRALHTAYGLDAA
jgi:aspartate kinase